jgi:V8-like Glu-specific endopeptidase
MAGTTTFCCFITLLIILPIFGRSIRQRNIEDYDRVVEISIKQILPMGMNISVYKDLVISYWTPERMASAKPMDLLMIDKSSGFNTVNHSPLTMGDERTPVRKVVPGVPPRSLKAAPSVVGKLYFTIGTSRYVCSGSVITSQNGDTMLTAGHCVFDTATQSWASDILFVPAYFDGSSPYGRWVWRTAAIMRGWTQRDFNYDVGVVLLATSDEGEHIQDLTGSLGMTINEERQANTVAYGYPVNIHRGEELASCTDESTPANIPQLPNFEGVKLPCNMTGGSSGGPWTQNSEYQTSVNSFGIVGQLDVMYGPYFGDAVYNLWNQYQVEP